MSRVATHPAPTGEIRTFAHDELIVSKTDLKGVITYANDVFVRVSGYTEAELIGAPHNIVRHPDFPGGVFTLLWQTIQSGREIFAYVKNLAADGDTYWVLAHVTPTFDSGGRIVGYHSSRRSPAPAAVAEISRVYDAMLGHERAHAHLGSAAAAAAGLEWIAGVLAGQDTTYDRFIWDLIQRTSPELAGLA